MNYKNQKIIQIIQENAYTGTNKFLINGIDLKLALFFIKKERELFKLVAKGDYTITNEGSNVFVVVNEATIKDSSAFQVGYELDTISSQYPTSEPEINLLKDKYNALVTDLQNLWGYVKKQSLVSDTLDMSLIFPVLGEGETWVFKDGEMKATPLIVAETELQKLLDELTKKSQDILDDYVATLTENSKTEILNFLEDNTENLLTKTEAEGIYVKNTQLSTETERGVISGLDFRGSEAAYVLGSEYGRVFGSTLTNVEAGKTYYYKDTTKNIYIPYKALNNYSNASGILVPDTTNFINISSAYLSDRIKSYRTGTNNAWLITQIDSSIYLSSDYPNIAVTYRGISVAGMYEYTAHLQLPVEIKKASAFVTISADIGGVAEYISNVSFNKENTNSIIIAFESPVKNLTSISLSLLIIGNI